MMSLSLASRRLMSSSAKTSGSLTVVRIKNGVRTVRMNRPRQLNGWTGPLMKEIIADFEEAAQDEETKVLAFTGTGPYYSAGVNLAGSFQPMTPRKFFKKIIIENENIFNAFLKFPKPILIAVNGHSIGATVTSATLCDAVIAAQGSTFSTPFHRLGITPEGCSSVHWPRLLGPTNANRMLGSEGWVPTAEEALAIGLITKVVPPETLMDEAQALAESWIAQGRKRTIPAGEHMGHLALVNRRESVDLANAFVSPKFIQGQINFLTSKGKNKEANVFKLIYATMPLWKKML
uniref:B0272.4 n=1 Tax=Caligus clemensi TaxID=344056 RepID=C1C070_CALCM|nr:B0272.4 [Caligus clemensi]